MEIDHSHRKHGKTLVLAMAVLFGGSIALLWGWNTFAVEVLSQQEIEFRHALALELLVLSIAGVIPIAWRLVGNRSR
jgi:hypothetical protein